MLYWIWLTTRPGFGIKSMRRLVEWFGSPEAVWQASEEQLAAVVLRDVQRAALMQKDLTAAQRIAEDCLRQGIAVLTEQDMQYPALLRGLPERPMLLYVRGTLPDFSAQLSLSIVGTRSATPYGLQAARYFAGNLAQNDCIVVSGMALGIDGEANRAAIEAGGTTIAVLGCGADVCYPWQNQKLMEDIIRTGAVVTEYPPGTEPVGKHFPVRNRIITGLSRGTLVIEAPHKSGALISADLALDQGRDVFAVPGDINRVNSAGCNLLIRQGAAELVQTPADILSHYAHDTHGISISPADSTEVMPVLQTKTPDRQPPKTEPKSVRMLDGTPQECTVWCAVRDGCGAVDAIVEHTGLPAAQVLSALTMLEVGAYVLHADTGYRTAADVQCGAIDTKS